MSSSFAHSRSTAPDHWRLAPSREGHWLVPVALALLAHGLLVGALTWGVGWKQDVETPVFEAELWSRLPVQAAPRAEAPPLPPPQPVPAEKVEPRPVPPPPDPSEAEIATQRAQKKKDEQRQAELDRQAAEKTAAADKAAADRKRLQDQKLAAEKKAADEKQAREDAERLRQDNIRRMLGQAGASGGPQATGTAPSSAGPSAGYGARVKARIKPNVVFTDDISGNPRTEVEVRTLPDGTIAARRIVKPSGNADWDEAALKAIDRTGTLPRDTDGRVPPSLIIVLQPKD